MKTEFNAQLKCATCGNDSSFEINEDKSYVKCNNCDREYLGGYDELVALNVGAVEETRAAMMKEAQEYAQKELQKSLGKSMNMKIKL